MSHSVKQLNDLTATGPSADYGPSSLSRAAAMLDSSSDSDSSSDDDSSAQQEVAQAARVSTGPVSSSGALSLAAAREAMLSSSSDSDTDADSDVNEKPEVKNDQSDSRPESFHPQSGPTSSIGLSMEKANAALLDSSESEESSESDQSEVEDVRPEVKVEASVKIEEKSEEMKIEDLEESLDHEDFQGEEVKPEVVTEEVVPFEEPIPVHNSTEVQMDIPEIPEESTTKMTPVQNVESDSETETYASEAPSVRNSQIEINLEVAEDRSQEDNIKNDPSLPDNNAVFAPAVSAVKSPIDPVNHDSSEKFEENEESETSHWSETSEGDQEKSASELNHETELQNGNQTGAFTNEVLKELEHRTSGNRLEVNGLEEILKTSEPADDEIPLKLCSVGQHVTVYGSKYFFRYGPVYI